VTKRSDSPPPLLFFPLLVLFLFLVCNLLFFSWENKTKVVVYLDRETQVKRLCARDKVEEKDALNTINAQWNLDEVLVIAVFFALSCVCVWSSSFPSFSILSFVRFFSTEKEISHNCCRQHRFIGATSRQS
jgi:hypothetical protein